MPENKTELMRVAAPAALLLAVATFIAGCTLMNPEVAEAFKDSMSRR